MQEISFTQAYREELRDTHTQFEQVVNVVTGTARLLGWWVLMTASNTSAIAILGFISVDIAVYTPEELQATLRLIVLACGCVAAFACLLANMGKFRDVFGDRAQHRIDREKALKAEIKEKTEEMERLLLRYKLIKAADIERHRETQQ